MSPEEAAEAARIHAAAFPPGPLRWSAARIAAHAAAPGAVALSRPGGFCLGRVAADEAELLILAVDPARRRAGIGRALLADFAAAARAAGAREAFLEVGADNAAARALYAAAGWTEAGRRRGYYAGGGGGVDALVLRLRLAPRKRGGAGA